MEIVNYLDIARNDLYKTFLHCMKKSKKEDYYIKSFENEECAREIFESLKSNKQLFNIYTQALFISNYLIAAFYAKSSATRKAQEEMDCYESYQNIEEFIAGFEFDKFTEMFFEMCSFIDDDYYDKKQYIFSLEEKKDYLKSMCPLFIYDYMYYTNSYNTNQIMNNYYKNMYEARRNLNDTERIRKKKEKIAFKETIMMNVDELIVLSENDFDNYKYLICKISEDVFRYLNYKLENSQKITKEEKEILLYIENDLITLILMSLGNKVILNHLVRLYIKYNVLDDAQCESINKYYDEEEKKEKLNKVLTISKKIKGEIE